MEVDEYGTHTGHASAEKALCEGYHLAYRVYVSGRKELVIEKESHILSQAEAQQHAPECIRAMRDELQRWHDNGGFGRYPRRQSTNLLDSRWVLKWAWTASSGQLRLA